MDIITQGLLGAVAAQTIAGRETVRRAALIGFLSGLPADADILIRSASDPLLTLEYHRQFTHSLLFIPVGGALMALILWAIMGRFARQPTSFLQLLPLTTIAYASSGLLDACTSYGTQLLWPFSDARIALSIVSVFDPVFSAILILFLIVGYRTLSPVFPRIGLGFALLYLGVGFTQNAQAGRLMDFIAQKRGHRMERMVVKPTLGNLLVWRGVYQFQNRYFVMALRVSPFSAPMVRYGRSLPVFDETTVLPGLKPESVLAKDIARFSHFSNRFVTLNHTRSTHPLLEDVRYAMFPYASDSLWGIRLDLENQGAHAPFLTFRQSDRETYDRFTAMLGTDWPEWKVVDVRSTR
ncbi:MAG: metal-dependent hydrolase [Magnetococcales bacterium]|nr:metal-dependent hydrolase [Magnetococcales bacterium]